MKEFDFDELDKAVNSLMAKKDAPADATASASTATPNTSQPDLSSQPADATIAVVKMAADDQPTAPANQPSTEPAQPARSASPAIAPRRGTVIDGFHSKASRPTASDEGFAAHKMRTLQPSLEPKVQAPASQPVIDMVKPASAASAPTAPSDDTPLENSEQSGNDSEKETPDSPAESLAPSANETSATDSGAAKKDTVENDTAADNNLTPSADDTDVKLDEVLKAPTPASLPPQPEHVSAESSPFLPNAKVEKRPLGHADAADNQTNSDTAKSSANLPAELHDDLITIESTDAKEPESIVKRYTPQPATPADETTEPAKISAHDPTDDSHESIYAADAHAQPLAHPPKKKSGMMTVVWILLLLVLGAGGGAALYFSGIL